MNSNQPTIYDFSVFFHLFVQHPLFTLGWLAGAMVLGKFPVLGRPANLDYSRARASALAVDGWGSVWTFFSFIYHFSSFSLSLMTLYRLKYVSKSR